MFSLFIDCQIAIAENKSHVQTQERSKPYTYTSIHKLNEYIQ